MCFLMLLVLLFGAFSSAVGSVEDLTFPPGFKFGVATAAYQIEGAWNVSDKSESIWDRVTHTHPFYVKNERTGDVASDSYHNWRRDIDMIVELGVHFYRFSISWPRLIPQGTSNHVSEDGKNYYNNLIDGLLEKGIEPIVTIYHWDMPLNLQNLGGWANPLIVDWFAHYARVVFSLYGDRVKTWITINEPIVICDLSHSFDGLAPGFLDEDMAPYLCNKHIVLAHAKAYRIYDEEFRKKLQYRGKVSLANQLLWVDPLNKENEELAELTRLNMARSSHPIFSKDGGWPSAIEKIIEDNSRKEGHPQSRLPKFSQTEIDFIKGTYDFYALNYYTSRLVRKAQPGEHFKIWPFEGCKDLNAVLEYHPTWNKTVLPWLFVNPEGLRKQLAWLKRQYGDIDFLISENGFPSRNGLNDVDRINYYEAHLRQVLLSIKEDKVNVTAYAAWSLLDNFEWMDGNTVKFGLYEVDTSPLRKRKARASARYFASVVASHSIHVPEDVYEDLTVEVNKSFLSSYNTWVAVLGVVSLFAITVLALVTYPRIKRTHNPNTETRRPIYVTVKTGAD